MRKREQLTTDEVKTGKIEQACARYGLGRGTMRKVAEEAGATIKIGRCLIINFDRMDKYMDSITG